ncbi:MAG: flagellar brake protein [Bacillota bacterium]
MSLTLAGFKVKQSQRIAVARSEDDSLEFVSSIENIVPGGIDISVPLKNQVPLELRRGDPVYLKVPMSSFALEFGTRVKSFKSENIVLVTLEHPDSFKRVQRRGSVRFKLLMNIFVAPEPPKGEEPVFTDATALDISAGGMELLTAQDYPGDSLLLVGFTLELDKKNRHRFLVKSKVCRVIPVSTKKNKIGVQFLDLTTSDTDRIFRYIFKKSSEKDFWRR